jgi:O-antigen biosynthesis protein
MPLDLRDRLEQARSAVCNRLRLLSRQLVPCPRPDPTVVRWQARRTRLVLPAAERPRVSIVIPVHGKLEYTWTCLASLARWPQRTPFETVVVDDCSPDETQQVLAAVRGLEVVRTPRNLGFIGACNAGAAAARGEYLCFLNNDTRVRPGWLDELTATFEREPDAGLVGARLLFRDGTLQEAGGLIWRDGTGANYGYGEDPGRPEYSYLREVDYCSGACIVVPAALFRALGGFDPCYAPAYYEDTDLAFRLRAQGSKCYLQPLAEVVHFEGATNGTDLAAGIKQHQLTNRWRFVARWRTELERHSPPTRDQHSVRDRWAELRLLVVDTRIPRPDCDSGSLRLFNLMRLCRRAGIKVSFLARESLRGATRYADELRRNGVEVLGRPWIHTLEQVLHRGDHDAVLLGRVTNVTRHLQSIRRRAPHLKVIFDTVDLHFLRVERQARLTGSAWHRRRARRWREQELAAARACDLTLVVSEAERELLLRECPGAKVMVLSNIHEEQAAVASFAERRDLLFVGGFEHPPNADAAVWLVREVLPLLRPRLPAEAVLRLVGSNPSRAVRALADGHGVVVTGQVPDLAPWLERSRLTVAPLRFGAGVKGKINLSMAHGVPVVATSVAVEGMKLVPGEDVLVADDAAGFADAVARLYHDPALFARLAERGRRSVRQHYSVEAALRAIEELKGHLRPPQGA